MKYIAIRRSSSMHVEAVHEQRSVPEPKSGSRRIPIATKVDLNMPFYAWYDRGGPTR
jgi:hypothetical protein